MCRPAGLGLIALASRHCRAGLSYAAAPRLNCCLRLAGIDLLSGEVLSLVRERHRSREFVEFLSLAHQHYPLGARIRLVLDNHSAHIFQETRAYLASVPNRFEFVFTPKHGSWLNLVESSFGKLARTLLRGIRVSSKQELRARLELYLQEVNESGLQVEIQTGDAGSRVRRIPMTGPYCYVI